MGGNSRQAESKGSKKAAGERQDEKTCPAAQFRKEAKCARSIRPERGGDLKSRASGGDFCGTSRDIDPSSAGTANISVSSGENGAASTLTDSVAPRHMQPDSLSHEPGGILRGRAGEPSAFTCREAIAPTTSADPTRHSQFETSTSSEKAAGSRERRRDVWLFTTSKVLGRRRNFNGSKLRKWKPADYATKDFMVFPRRTSNLI
jgi:hypothetical protein